MSVSHWLSDSQGLSLVTPDSGNDKQLLQEKPEEQRLGYLNSYLSLQSWHCFSESDDVIASVPVPVLPNPYWEGYLTIQGE